MQMERDSNATQQSRRPKLVKVHRFNPNIVQHIMTTNETRMISLTHIKNSKTINFEEYG
jgi:hypothetical protein